MSKVPSYIRQKSRENMKEYNEYLYKRMDILENSFKESKDILKLTNEEMEKVKNFDINTLDDLMYINNKINGNIDLYTKIVAKVLVRFVRLNILTKDETKKLFKDNMIEKDILFFIKPFSLEFQLILLNLIFNIQEKSIHYVSDYQDFGIKVNFIISNSNKNMILYGAKVIESNISYRIISIINKLKENENYKLYKIIDKYKNLKMK